MRTLSFQGHSDDLFCMDGKQGDEPDEMGCFNGMAVVSVLAQNGDGVLVTGGYDWTGAPRCLPGCWMIGLSPTDEDKPLPPAWPIRWKTADNGYSLRLEIDVPDDVTVKRIDSE